MRYSPGDIVEVIDVPDQGSWTKRLVEKKGVLVEKLATPDVVSSDRIWRVYIEERFEHLHELDFKLVIINR